MPCCSKVVVKPAAAEPDTLLPGAEDTVRPAAPSCWRPLASSSSRTDWSPAAEVTTRLLAKAPTFLDERSTRSMSATPVALSVASVHPSGGTTVKAPERPRTSSPAAVAAEPVGVDVAPDAEAGLLAGGEAVVSFEQPVSTRAQVRTPTETTRVGRAFMRTIQPQVAGDRRSGLGPETPLRRQNGVPAWPRPAPPGRRRPGRRPPRG